MSHHRGLQVGPAILRPGSQRFPPRVCRCFHITNSSVKTGETLHVARQLVYHNNVSMSRTSVSREICTD